MRKQKYYTLTRCITQVCITALVCLTAYGQEGSTTNPTEGPPHAGWTQLLFYPGGTNLEYVCQARTPQPAFAWTRSASTLTSITDAANTSTIVTSTAHGLQVGNAVSIIGATGDADLNGTYYVQGIVSATDFTVTTANVTDAAYTEASLTVQTTAPRSTAPIWSIQKMTYVGANMVLKQWAGGNPAYKAICDNRAVNTGANKVTYQ
jgi:hypothetical protein